MYLLWLKQYAILQPFANQLPQGHDDPATKVAETMECKPVLSDPNYLWA